MTIAISPKKIAAYLNKSDHYRFLSSYTSAEEALVHLPKDRPHVVLMDINLGGMNGIECVRQLQQFLPKTPVVMLTVFEDTGKFSTPSRRERAAISSKGCRPQNFSTPSRKWSAGGSPMSAPIARKVIQMLKNTPAPADDTTNLSDREREVLDGMAAGQPYKEIADQLGVSVHTVRSYIRRIYEKLHVRTRTEAVAKYFRH